jgi:thioredoxin-related protein
METPSTRRWVVKPSSNAYNSRSPKKPNVFFSTEELKLHIVDLNDLVDISVEVLSDSEWHPLLVLEGNTCSLCNRFDIHELDELVDILTTYNLRWNNTETLFFCENGNNLNIFRRLLAENLGRYEPRWFFLVEPIKCFKDELHSSKRRNTHD